MKNLENSDKSWRENDNHFQITIESEELERDHATKFKKSIFCTITVL